MDNRQIKVLVVDDSAFIRVLLTQILDSDEEITVVATAEDPYEAREKIKKYKPDVLTLDVEMPKMDGLTFLKNIMRLHPMPVVMVSTLTQNGAEVTLKALNLGAFDFIGKPQNDVKDKLSELGGELIGKIKAAAKCDTATLEKNESRIVKKLKLEKNSSKVDIITIGASTGGTEAIQSIMTQLPTNLPPIVMAQHIPDIFSTSYAKRLNGEVDIQVIEVRKPERLKSGHAYLAPGHMHMKVKYRGSELWAYLTDDEPVNRHKPAVDVLFDSVCQAVDERCIAVLLTGMGQDGAKGLLRLRQAGALTIAQDEFSSVVWGMPGAAVKIEAAASILGLNEIPAYLIASM